MRPTNVELRPLIELKRWDRNYRVGDVSAIVASIVRFGFNGALKVWNGQVMAGNHAFVALETIQANGGRPPLGVVATEAGWQVPVIDVSHLNRTEAEGYAIADNRTSELGKNDPSALATLLERLADEDPESFKATGYADADIKKLLAEAKAAEESSKAKTGEPEIPEQWIVYVECADEPAQTGLLERLIDEGFACRALTS